MSSADETLFRLRGVHKSYAAPVLTAIHLEVRAGEVHALMGANGAGKSTLAKVISGLVAPDQGEMFLAGERYAPAGKAGAEALGVHIVQQELNLIGTLSVAENLFLNRLPARFGFVASGTLYREAREALKAVGLEDVDPDTKVEELGVGKQQLVEIAAALTRRCRVLILDEPTAALTDPQVELLFQHIDRLKASGVGIVYISHRLEELRQIADRATILRDGEVVTSEAFSELTLEEIVRRMVGQDGDDLTQQRARDGRPEGGLEEEIDESPDGTAVGLRVQGLCRGSFVQDVTFEVRRGEIFGISGLVGSGRTELLRAIFGADRAESGTVQVGEIEPQLFSSPRDAVRAGLALIPEDRKHQGLLLTQSVRVNLTLGKIQELANAFGWIGAREEENEARQASLRLRVRSTGLEQEVAELSGGNQQKVVIGRSLLGHAEVFLFDEPTRGIDVGAKAVVYQLLKDLAEEGKCVLVVSSELLELLAICDRIGVLSAGRMAAIFNREDASQEKILNASFSGYVG